MCKVFVAVFILIVAVYSSEDQPSLEEIKAELTNAGISSGAADGIIVIGEKHKGEFEAAENDHEAAKAAFNTVKSEIDTFIKAQSEADQAAYAAFVEKKSGEFEQLEKSAGASH